MNGPSGGTSVSRPLIVVSPGWSDCVERHHKHPAVTGMTITGRKNHKVISGMGRCLANKFAELVKAIRFTSSGEAIVFLLDCAGRRALSQRVEQTYHLHRRTPVCVKLKRDLFIGFILALAGVK